MNAQYDGDERDIIRVRVTNCFNPDSIDWEYKTYNFIAVVDVLGYHREHYFMERDEGIVWAQKYVYRLLDRVYNPADK